jgi:hypothetical protein
MAVDISYLINAVHIVKEDCGKIFELGEEEGLSWRV